ncbi:MAG TPA: hypothetical protein VGZ73_14635 [Bryobacteraceae bacterium]|jgi:hypothetical protein|nr:hypothetical protein [Bryobacteraceae bacterium]
MLIRKVLIGVLAVAAADAQAPDPVRGRGHFGTPPAPIFDGSARFLAAEPGRPGRVVRNAPYSADVITESSQALPDGNHIRQSSTVHVSRDSEGRTRSEQSLHTLGGLAPNANLPQVVFINDPVTNTNYALNPANRTAAKSTWERPAAADRPMIGRPESGATPNATDRSVVRGFRRGGTDPNLKTEPLGRQTIEGLVAEGTRTTRTIPAGQIGNDQPIQVVTEVWYSGELQTVVLSKRTDPRTGETVTRLASVSRSEPPHALFEVPPDFKVTETAGRSGRGTGAK